MKLEDQVAPLELAQRMKELGFPQNTFANWVTNDLEEDVEPYPALDVEILDDFAGRCEVLCAAPTVAEMGEWLIRNEEHDVFTSRTGPLARQEWYVGYREHDLQGDTEAEARAHLLIALVEAGKIDPRLTSSGAV